MAVNLIVELLPCQPNLLSIDDDQTTAVIDVRCVIRRILAHQHQRGTGRQPSQHPTFCIYHIPVNLSSTRLGEVSPHSTLRSYPQVANLNLYLRLPVLVNKLRRGVVSQFKKSFESGVLCHGMIDHVNPRQDAMANRPQDRMIALPRNQNGKAGSNTHCLPRNPKEHIVVHKPLPNTA